MLYFIEVYPYKTKNLHIHNWFTMRYVVGNGFDAKRKSRQVNGATISRNGGINVFPSKKYDKNAFESYLHQLKT